MDTELIAIGWMVLSAALVLLMQGGFLCIESGLVRSKNSINVALKNLVDFCLAGLMYFAFGFALMFGSSYGGWIGAQGFFLNGHDRAWDLAFFLFQLVFCGTAITIISGAVAERMRFGAYVLVTVVVSAFVYPVTGHWIWGGAMPGTEPGWLARMGFIDFAGSTAVHAVGGWSALAVVLIIGARTGRFASATEDRQVIRGHNLSLAVLGVILLWFGWFGFNGGSTLALNADVPGILVNTTLAAAAGGVVALSMACLLVHRPDVMLTMNGVIAGLVGVTAGCHILTPMAAAFVGGIAGLLCVGATILLERFEIDDVIGAVPAHAVAGSWGTLAVALFADPSKFSEGQDRIGQLGVQLVGVAVVFVWAFGITFAVVFALNRWRALRVSVADEMVGLNVVEQGASTEIIDLMIDMASQSVSSDYSARVQVEPHTEVGQIAAQYNRVLDRVERDQVTLLSATDEAQAREQRFRQLAAFAPIGIFEAGADGAVTYVNPAVSQMLGYVEEDCLGDGWIDSVVESERDEVRHGWRDAVDRVVSYTSEIRLLREDSEGVQRAMVVNCMAHPVKDEGNRLVGYVGILVDITERWTHAEALLRQSAELQASRSSLADQTQTLTAVLNSMGEGVVVCSLDGTFLHFNAAAERILGNGPQPGGPSSWSETYGIYDPETRVLLPTEALPMVRALAGETCVNETLLVGRLQRAISTYGDEVYAEVSASPVRDSVRGMIGAVCVLRDVTERRELEGALGRAQKLESIGQLAAGIAHEINTPTQYVGDNTRFLEESFRDLAPIITMAGKLAAAVRAGTDADTLATALETALEAADVDYLVEEIPCAIAQSKEGIDRVRKIVQSMKEFSHPGAEGMDSIDLNRAIRSTITVATNEWKYVANLEVDLDPTLPLVPCLPGDINQVVLNLIVNAAHAIGDVLSDGGTEKGTIAVNTRAVGEVVEIRISDTGSGIPIEARDRIFDQFFTTKEVGKGTGQGLSLAYAVVVQKHGGTIDFETELGKGTTFIVRLPLATHPV